MAFHCRRPMKSLVCMTKLLFYKFMNGVGMTESHGFSPTKATLLTILLCSMLMLMGGAAVAPALPLIEQVFPDQGTLVSMIITVPSLAVGLVGFAMGALADRLGKVRVLSTSLVVFTVAGVVGFLMDGSSDEQLYVLLAFRFIVGIGIAGISSSVTALIAEYYGGMNRIKVLSYQSAAMGLGVLILEYTGGLLAEFSWREPFLVYLIGVPILIMVLLTMREPKRDVPEDVARVVPERKANGRLLAVCYATIFIAMTMAFLLPTKMPTYLQTELAVTTSATGLFLGVHGVTNACMSLMYRRLVQRIPPFKIISIGFFLLAASLVFLKISESIASSIALMVVAGIALGMISPAVSNTLAAETTATTSGKIMGGYSTCLNLGQFSISLISVPLFAAVGNSYPDLFAVMAVVAVVVGLTFIVLSRSSLATGKASA